MSRRLRLRRVGLLVLGANAGLTALLGVAALRSGSLAVGSEAINSLADTAYSLVVVGGLYLTTQPPDPTHPHGHERIEPFVSLAVAAGIFVAGGAVLWGAVTGLTVGDSALAPGHGPLAVVVLVATGAVKFVLYRYCLRVGRASGSPALVATAVDNRNDILAAGAALAGVAGTAAGYPRLDAVAALLVGVAVVYTGLGVVRDNVDYLIGAAPPEGLRADIVERALEVDAVEGVHDVVAHYVGPEIDVSLHIEVAGDHTLREAHNIETAVAAAIAALPEVDDVFVHVDPENLDEWKADPEVDRLVGDSP